MFGIKSCAAKIHKSSDDMLSWRTVYRFYLLVVVTCTLSQQVLSQGNVYRPGSQPSSSSFGSPYNNKNNWKPDQYQSSGSDGVGFEEDDDLPMSSGDGPVSPPVNQPPKGGPPVNQPPKDGSNRPGQEGNNRGNSGNNDDDLFDSWRNNKNNQLPSGGNKYPPGRRPEDDDDGDLFESSGDIIMEPERKHEVPNSGGEVRVDLPTQYPPYVPFPTSRQRPAGPNLPADRSSPQQPSDPWLQTTTRDLIIRPEGDWNAEKDSHEHSYKGTSAFFRIFNDPLVLAGIISGAVLALLCIVLIVMYMIYRMKKKDEGSYALGEPKRTYDIRYTRTKDQEFFA